VNLHEFFHTEVLEQVKIKLLFEYHNYLNIFNWAMINQLSLHHFYNHKIELIDEETSSWSKLYQMFNHKLQKIKKYLINHLNKEFIFFSFASYVLLILFIEKKDDSLRFCVNYRKFNALIKCRLIIELSFELTFWTWINIESSCLHFQLDSSWVAHIFNSTRLNSTRDWVNLTWLVKNLNLTSRVLRIET